MESREGYSYTVVPTMFGCQWEVGREKLELQKKVQAVSSPKQHNGICRYWLFQKEGPSSISRRDEGEIASGARRLTDLVGTVTLSVVSIGNEGRASPVREAEGS